MSVDYLINGQHGQALDVHDRGLHYGDGLFETLEVYQGHTLFWEPHVQRLSAGCQRLNIPCPDLTQLQQETQPLIRACEHGVLKIMITRGCGGRGYKPPEQPTPTRLLSLHPWPDYPPAYSQQGSHAIFCRTRLGLNPDLAGLKHLNRLEQVLARAEWQQPDIQEGLMQTVQGSIIEGTMTNVFYVRDGILVTPAITQAGVKGIVRALIIKLAQQEGMSILEARVTAEDLLAADEIFLTNSIIGVWPVRQLGEKPFKIGTVTQRLQAKYQQLWRQQVDNA